MRINGERVIKRRPIFQFGRGRLCSYKLQNARGSELNGRSCEALYKAGRLARLQPSVLSAHRSHL